MAIENLEEPNEKTEKNTDDLKPQHETESIPGNQEASDKTETLNSSQNGTDQSCANKDETNQNNVLDENEKHNSVDDNKDKNNALNGKEESNSVSDKNEKRLSNYLNNIKISKSGAELSLSEDKDKEATLLSDSKTVVRFSPVWKQVNTYTDAYSSSSQP